jgi:hypothetical protein
VPRALRACGIGPDGRGGRGQRQRGVVVAHACGMACCSWCRRQPGPQGARRTTGEQARACWQGGERPRRSRIVPMAATRQDPRQGYARGGACRPDLG